MNRYVKHVFYRLIMLAFAVAIMVGAGYVNTTASEFTSKSSRSVMMVDAYERFSESGKPYWKGIFTDDQLGTRFEWDLEPRTFRQFMADDTPRAMIVVASREDVNDPETPSGKIFFSVLGIISGFMFFCWQLIGLLFFWPSKYDW